MEPGEISIKHGDECFWRDFIIYSSQEEKANRESTDLIRRQEWVKDTQKLLLSAAAAAVFEEAPGKAK